MSVATFPTLTFTGVANGPGIAISGFINLYMWGAIATVLLETSFDGGSTWVPVSADAAGTPTSFTTTVAGYKVTLFEPERNVLTRLRCTAVTGTLSYRFSH